jgi:hypothetical protein
MLLDCKRPVTSKGDLLALGSEGSMGEFAPEGDADLGWLWGCVEYPSGKWSDLEFDIINYLVGVMSWTYIVGQLQYLYVVYVELFGSLD